MRTYNSKALGSPTPILSYVDIHKPSVPSFPNLSSEQMAQKNIVEYNQLPDPPSNSFCPAINATIHQNILSDWDTEVRTWDNLTTETWDTIFYTIVYGCCNCDCLPSIPSGYMADSVNNCSNGPWIGNTLI